MRGDRQGDDNNSYLTDQDTLYNITHYLTMSANKDSSRPAEDLFSVRQAPWYPLVLSVMRTWQDLRLNILTINRTRSHTSKD